MSGHHVDAQAFTLRLFARHSRPVCGRSRTSAAFCLLAVSVGTALSLAAFPASAQGPGGPPV